MIESDLRNLIGRHKFDFEFEFGKAAAVDCGPKRASARIQYLVWYGVGNGSLKREWGAGEGYGEDVKEW